MTLNITVLTGEDTHLDVEVEARFHAGEFDGYHWDRTAYTEVENAAIDEYIAEYEHELDYMLEQEMGEAYKDAQNDAGFDAWCDQEDRR